MKITRQRNRVEGLQTGQIWQMEGSHLRIGVVGKTLVHYKHFKGDAKRCFISLSGKVVLERFLKAQGAILVGPECEQVEKIRAVRP
jgi:hypothetical protein